MAGLTFQGEGITLSGSREAAIRCTCMAPAAAPRTATAANIRKIRKPMTEKPKSPSGQEGFFWKTKTLEEMSDAEWESLCDGCARCCLEKLEDEDTGKIYFTHVSCKLLDAGLCACKDYTAPFRAGSRLCQADARQCAHAELAAAELRLPPGRRRPRPLLVAPADFGRPQYGSRSRRFRARTRAGNRERNRRRRSRRSYRAVAGASAQARPAEKAPVLLSDNRCSCRPSLRRDAPMRPRCCRDLDSPPK